MKLPAIKIGDVFSIPLTNGLGFIQCVKEAPKTECEVLRVLPGIYSESEEIQTIIEKKEIFFTQLAMKYALKKNMISFIGNFPVPNDTQVPRHYRTEHHIGTEFVCWHIVDSVTLKRESVKTLSPEQKKLSEWDFISIPDLVEKIESNWTPEKWG